MNVNNWLKLARRMRILSTFPRLCTLQTTYKLALTVEENTRKGWMKMAEGRLYEFAGTDCPFQLDVKDICSLQHCTKLARMREVIDREWEKDEKAVWFTMGPTNALILYWVSLD